MKKFIVIADDITGAAEMAGVAWRMGCKVNFTTSPEGLSTEGADVAVLATDTRSMNRADAEAVTEQIVGTLRRDPTVHIFKKTDSVLRGHVAAELRILMRMGYDRALLLPANPSKGRCITDGIYTVGDVPLCDTVFGSDPEFPARTADVTTIVGDGAQSVKPDTENLPVGISIGDSSSDEDSAAYVRRFAGGEILFAGAADTFRALLAAEGYSQRDVEPFPGLGNARTLLVFGSTVRHDIMQQPFFVCNRVVVSNMPDDVFAGADPQQWCDRMIDECRNADSVVLRIPQRAEVDAAKARWLRRAMADVAACAVEEYAPHEVVIEGGATAFAVLAELAWRDFTVNCEIAAGVVRLYHAKSGTFVTFKPGSYPWGEMFA